MLYVDDGNVLTSAGSAAGIDLLLHVVRSDFGPTAANKVARRLVVAPHRSGGQRQFIEAPVPPQHNERLSILFDCVRASPARRWSLNDMARASAMSARTFSRRFRELTGLSPGEWLIQERIAFARRLLELKRANLGEIAEAVGLGGPENLIRQFRRRVGVTPQSYRRTFSTADR